MHHHHRGGPGSGLPVPPPPPLLSSRSRGSGSRPSGRSRSRSRSRSPPRSKYHGGGGRNERESRDLRERVDRDRERERDRDRERRRSASPYGSSSRSERDRERDRDSSRKTGTSSTTKPSASLDSLPSISLIQSENALTRSIIRSILNPEDVKIPRRVNEGSKPIFEREELREAMARRMRTNDNEENPPQANAYIQEPTVTQQRVVAIIREPVGADLYLASKDPAFPHHALVASSAKVSSSTANIAGILQRLSPEPHLRSYRRSASPPPSRSIRQSGRPSPAPPPPVISSRARSPADRERERERERIILERERDREQLQRVLEREQIGRGGAGRGDRERDRILHPERERDLLHEIRGGDRDRDRERERDRERDQREKSRFGGGPPAVTHHPLDRMEPHRARSRSPISRVLREDSRLRRRSRSHSVTPPPMPEEIRRQLLERQRNIDLRNSLSRRPAKFLVEHEERGAKGERGGPPTRGVGRGRGFSSRSGRGREDGRVWVHDMYDGDDEPKKGD